MVSLQENNTDIHEHAVDRYIERVDGTNPAVASRDLRETARFYIMEAVKDPEAKVNGETSNTPIHISGDVAVPVDKSRLPGGNAVVPTTYHAEVFLP